MKILFVAHRIPFPPVKGEKIRAYQVLKRLARRHEVHLFCLADRREDLASADALREFLARVEVAYVHPLVSRIRALRRLLGTKPITLGFFHSPALLRAVRNAAARESFDVAVAYSSAVIPYLDGLGLPRVLDMVDLDSRKWSDYAAETGFPMGWVYGREARTLFDYERSSAREAEATLLVSSEEGRYLAKHGSPRNLEVVALGVDTDRVDPEKTLPAEDVDSTRPWVAFVGAMDYRPNVEAAVRFARNILPRVRREVSDAGFLVVGGRPASAVRALDDGGKTVRVTGRVPDTLPYLKAARAAAIPLAIARGMQTKVLEAMAMGKPLVLTTAAATGVDGESGRDYRVADDDGDIAREVTRLLTAPEEARALGERARDYVKRRFALADKLKRYEEILEAAAALSVSAGSGAASTSDPATAPSGGGGLP